jgi:hypothetical protein
VPNYSLKDRLKARRKDTSAPLCRTLRCSMYAYTRPRQQEPGITAHLPPFLRAFSRFSSFISLSQLIKLG